MKHLGQSKIGTAIESILNVASGILIAFTISQLAFYNQEFIQNYLYTDFHWDINYESNIIMTLVLTVVSILRGMVWRRLFNHFHVKKLEKYFTEISK